jgi:hypothetical protein
MAVTDNKFRPFNLRIRIDDPEEADVFEAGLILAQSNNNSHLWAELIDGINTAMRPYRQLLIAQQKGEA